MEMPFILFMAILGMNEEIYAYFATCLISVLAITNPLSTIGVYLSLTKNEKPEEKAKIAFRAALVAFCVLIFFSLTGFFIFQIYGITIDSFRIAGGAILMVIGMRMLFPPKSEQSGLQASPAQVYVVPLAIPMTSGPGAITTTVVLASQAKNLWFEIALWAAIFIACAINFLVLKFSATIERKLGQEGISALVKIMGLLVCSIAVQFIINGLKAAFPTLG
ncbi:MAG: MarC family protein [Candidatus Micrarchaeota archaeon]|nr:MarC family protein [Candidatus Micrarchaeota archaeon]